MCLWIVTVAELWSMHLIFHLTGLFCKTQLFDRCRPQKQQAGSGLDRPAGVGGSQALTVMVQGQGQTTGQLQVIPQGVTVIPGPGQQLMQAALPNGQVQRFLFAPLPSAATSTSSTGLATPQLPLLHKETEIKFSQAPWETMRKRLNLK